ncbi:MAG: hypothetical protein P8X48_02000 [Acidiferrobacteraceae bacterium]|jgi:hypothetical protein
MKRKTFAIVLVLISVSGLSACATAVFSSHRLSFEEAEMARGVVISERDRNLIAEWYRGKAFGRGPGALPEGFVKLDLLPSNLEGIGLPRALERKLTPLPHDYVRRIIGRDIVLMRRTDRAVVDLYRDALP